VGSHPPSRSPFTHEYRTWNCIGFRKRNWRRGWDYSGLPWPSPSGPACNCSNLAPADLYSGLPWPSPFGPPSRCFGVPVRYPADWSNPETWVLTHPPVHLSRVNIGHGIATDFANGTGGEGGITRHVHVPRPSGRLRAASAFQSAILRTGRTLKRGFSPTLPFTFHA